MRRKTLVALLVVAMAGVFAGISQAAVITFNDTKMLNQGLGPLGNYSYTHAIPAELAVPPDVINVATLNLVYTDAFGKYKLSVAGTTVAGSNRFYFGGGSSNFNIAALLDPWVAGTTSLQIDVTGLGWITLVASNLHLEYTPAAPNPEPGTLMLLGSGLVGLAAYGRMKFRK